MTHDMRFNLHSRLQVLAITSERACQQTLRGCHALGGTPTRLAEVLLLLWLCGNCSTNHNDCRRKWRDSGPRRRSPFGSGVAMATDALQLAENEISLN